MLEVLDDYVGLGEHDDLYRAAAYVLSQNIVHGDARTMLTSTGHPITFAEWGYLGKGKFQRRDFRFDTLTQMSSFGEDTLFADLGTHEIFTPIKSYAPLTAARIWPRELRLGRVCAPWSQPRCAHLHRDKPVQ